MLLENRKRIPLFPKKSDAFTSPRFLRLLVEPLVVDVWWSKRAFVRSSGCVGLFGEWVIIANQDIFLHLLGNMLFVSFLVSKLVWKAHNFQPNSVLFLNSCTDRTTEDPISLLFFQTQPNSLYPNSFSMWSKRSVTGTKSFIKR
jgi:hypothetical protein